MKIQKKYVKLTVMERTLENPTEIEIKEMINNKWSIKKIEYYYCSSSNLPNISLTKTKKQKIIFER